MGNNANLLAADCSSIEYIDYVLGLPLVCNMGSKELANNVFTMVAGNSLTSNFYRANRMLKTED